MCAKSEKRSLSGPRGGFQERWRVSGLSSPGPANGQGHVADIPCQFGEPKAIRASYAAALFFFFLQGEDKLFSWAMKRLLYFYFAFNSLGVLQMQPMREAAQQLARKNHHLSKRHRAEQSLLRPLVDTQISRV